MCAPDVSQPLERLTPGRAACVRQSIEIVIENPCRFLQLAPYRISPGVTQDEGDWASTSRIWYEPVRIATRRSAEWPVRSRRRGTEGILGQPGPQGGAKRPRDPSPTRICLQVHPLPKTRESPNIRFGGSRAWNQKHPLAPPSVSSVAPQAESPWPAGDRRT